MSDFNSWCTEKQLKGRCIMPSENDCLICEAQEKQEIEELEKKVEGLEIITHEQSLVMKAYKLQFKSQMEANESRREENEALKKRLSDAVEVIRFYSVSQNYGYNQDVDNHVEWIGDEEHQPMGKKARAFLKGDKDE